jgi:hypothetical protein
MKVPSTTTLSFPTLLPLLSAGKNIDGLFLLWVSPSSLQNLMQYLCSKRSVILSEMRMRRTRVTPLRYLAVTGGASGGVARQQNICMRMKVPSTTMLSFPTFPPLLSTGKYTVR